MEVCTSRLSSGARAGRGALCAAALLACAAPIVRVALGGAGDAAPTRLAPGGDHTDQPFAPPALFGLRSQAAGDGAAPAAQAAPRDEDALFVQQPIADNTGVGPLALLAISTCCPFNTVAADDFMINHAAPLTRVEWVGVYFGSVTDFPGQDAAFRITIYEDNGSGNVGRVVADRQYGGGGVQKALHPRPLILARYPVYAFTANVSPPVQLEANKRYWLSIDGNPAGVSGPAFGWLASPSGNAAATPAADQPLQNRLVTCETLPASTFTPGSDLGLDADLAFALFSSCVPGDCNCNGQSDSIDIATGVSRDCNGNGRPDECDISLGFSTDCNGNGVPDECELSAPYSAASPPLTPIGSTNAQVWRLPAPPSAMNNVVITVSARADLSLASEYLTLTLNDAPLGNLFTAGGHDCPAAPDVQTVTMTASAYNALVQGRDAMFRVTASADVATNLCGAGGFVSISVAYTRMALPDCNGNGVIDSCDIANGFSRDCNHDGVPDECQLDAIYTFTSPAMSPIGIESPQAFTMLGAPRASGPVTLAFTAHADLSDAGEYIDVYINNVSVGRVFETGGHDCPSTPDTAALTLTAQAFNAALGASASGNALVSLRPSPAVGATLCGANDFVRVVASYLVHGGADCNHDGRLDSCQIAAGELPDVNHNGVADGCERIADLNGDGVINAVDLAILLSEWGTPGPRGDLNHDGIVDSRDLSLLLSYYN